MVFLHGERLPYGIISGGTIRHGICSLIMKFVCGGGGGGEIYHRGGALPYGSVSLWGSSAMVFLQGERLQNGILSGGCFCEGRIPM